MPIGRVEALILFAHGSTTVKATPSAGFEPATLGLEVRRNRVQGVGSSSFGSIASREFG